MKKYDAIIIGFGKAGKTLAVTLKNEGKKVALIEKNPDMYGGTCINIGCIPTKVLVHRSRQSDILNFESFEEKNEFFKKAIERKDALTSKLRQKNYNMLNGVDIYDGLGSFVENKVVKVISKDKEEILTADKIYINTGAKSRKLDVKTKGNPDLFYSTEIQNLKELPKSLVIIGSGYIGLEFATMFSKFGSKVTILENSDKFLPREDEDVSKLIKERLENQNIDLHFSVKIEEINKNIVNEVVTNVGRFEADAILVGIGRVANTEGLGLENTDIEINERGFIKVDEYLKTSVEDVYALGDVSGHEQFTYTSLDDFRIIRGIVNHNTSTRLIPYSVFIDPALSHVGIKEKDLNGDEDVKVFRLEVSNIPKANVIENPYGLFKAIVDMKTEKILGCTLYGEESYELINIIKTVMDLGGSYKQLKTQIFTHPTMAESLNDLFK